MLEVITIDATPLKRLIVLDISGICAEVYDEAYLPIDRLDLINTFTHKYANKNKYIVIGI